LPRVRRFPPAPEHDQADLNRPVRRWSASASRRRPEAEGGPEARQRLPPWQRRL